MSKNTDSDILWFCVVVFLLMFGGCSVNLYRASVQSDVYRRQGVEMSTLECFFGAKPVERIISVK